MSLNYKNDDSFFMMVRPPFTIYGTAIKKWFDDNPQSRFRYIKDPETEKEFWNLKLIDETYPGVKSIMVMVNPWARMKYAYDTLLALSELENNDYDIDVSLFELESFDLFIKSLPNMTSSNLYWFDITTPLVDWLEYDVDGVTKQVDFIIRDTDMSEDFKPIQEYFMIDIPLASIELIDYKKAYAKETKDIVSKIFAEDIKRFKYKF
jgi:hypothetical protein